MKRILGIAFCLTLIFGFLAPSTFAKNTSSDDIWTTLTDLSNQIFLYTEDGKISKAQNTMDLFESEWSKVENQVSEKNARVINASFDQLKETFNNEFEDEVALTNAATEFRLAVDALTNNEDPLWKHMDKKFLSQFAKIQTAANQGDIGYYHSQLNQFLQDYSIIYPALVIDLNPRQLKKINGDIDSLTVGTVTNVNNEKNLQALNQIYGDFNRMFGHSGVGNTPNLLWIALFLGITILFTLIYVAWKKYNGDYRITSYKYFS